MIKTKIGKNLILVFLILIVREFGILDLNFHQSWLKITTRIGDIPKGGLKGKDFKIEIDWGNHQINQQGEGEELVVKIREFNNWSLSLFQPIIKTYKPKFRGEIYNGEGQWIGEIEMTGELKSKGLISRNKQLKLVRKDMSKEIITYLLTRNLEKGEIKWRCKVGILLYPISQLQKEFLPLLSPQTETLYCMNYEESHWRDTIYYENYYAKEDSLIGYEVMSIDLGNQKIEQRVYYNDGKEARVVKYEVDKNNDINLGNWHKEMGKDNFELIMPKTKEVKIKNRLGEIIFKEEYDY